MRITGTIMPGTLYIVATPIGNLKDITLRAIETLKTVDIIACEDTRHTATLLKHYDISKPLTSYFEHNKTKKAKKIIDLLKKGKEVALCSDAGTPGISDPGYRVINDAINEGVEVIPIPGASAAISALSVSGMPTDKFFFEGFLSSKGAARKKRLKEISALKHTIIIYESPHRILVTLKDMQEVLGDIDLVCAREITKKFEEIRRSGIGDAITYFSEHTRKGEFVIIFNPRKKALK
ncbi:16S rRNA (cytidine(1402)-2'-O)-methyltransferase [Candidatus Omnitrophota bacterium]